MDDSAVPVETARSLALEGRWDEVQRVLGPEPGDAERVAGATTPASARWLAEALWRGGDAVSALDLIDKTLPTGSSDEDNRALIVLRADILFATGSVDRACDDYAHATRLAESMWVGSQLGRCEDRKLLPQEPAS